eukprot:7389182-Prymnesium_polylepis.1
MELAFGSASSARPAASTRAAAPSMCGSRSSSSGVARSSMSCNASTNSSGSETQCGMPRGSTPSSGSRYCSSGVSCALSLLSAKAPGTSRSTAPASTADVVTRAPSSSATRL